MPTRRFILRGVLPALAAAAGAGAAEAGSMVRSLAYDAQTQTLTVALADGRTLRYLRVPERVYRDFQASKSKTSFYRLHIQGRYEFTTR